MLAELLRSAGKRTEQSHAKSILCLACRRDGFRARAADRRRTRFSVLHQELRLWRRPRRLQFCELSAMPGDGFRTSGLLRRKPLFQRRRRRTVRQHPPIPEEILMRILVLAIALIATLSAAAPASAQTYAPGYPICMQVWGPIN